MVCRILSLTFCGWCRQVSSSCVWTAPSQVENSLRCNGGPSCFGRHFYFLGTGGHIGKRGVRLFGGYGSDFLFPPFLLYVCCCHPASAAAGWANRYADTGWKAGCHL